MQLYVCMWEMHIPLNTPRWAAHLQTVMDINLHNQPQAQAVLGNKEEIWKQQVF